MGSFIYAESSQNLGLNAEALVPYLVLPKTKKVKLILTNYWTKQEALATLVTAHILIPLLHPL